MSTPKHTPGPWKWNQESVDPEWAVVTSEGGNVVANVNSETGPDIPPLVSTKMPQHANAHLIAAAPAMYEALQGLVKELNAKQFRTVIDGTESELFKQYGHALNALAKAEGKTL